MPALLFLFFSPVFKIGVVTAVDDGEDEFSTNAEALRNGRMCYNHLAGTVGVSLSDALVDMHVLDTSDDGYTITPHGKQWLYHFGEVDHAQSL